jgi:hypothetical protein
MFIFLSNHDGFGLNNNILETNILNLSVVVSVLIYYGRIVLFVTFNF